MFDVSDETTLKGAIVVRLKRTSVIRRRSMNEGQKNLGTTEFCHKFCMSTSEPVIDYLSIPLGRIEYPGLGFLWIGSKKDASDLRVLRERSICFVLNCTRDHLDGGVKNFHEKEPGFRYHRIPLRDVDSEVCHSLYQDIYCPDATFVCSPGSLAIYKSRQRDGLRMSGSLCDG